MINKTIWVINQTAGKPTSGWGERHYQFSKYWVKRGYEVFIISGSHNHLFINQPEMFNKTFAIEKTENNISFCWIKTPKYFDGGYRKYWSNIIFTLKLFFIPFSKVKKPNIIIVSSMPIFPIINAYFIKKRFGNIKWITEIRDLWPLTPIHLKGYSKKHPFIKIISWLEKFAYLKSDYIVSLLPNAYLYINPISKDPEKFSYIPNGMDEIKLHNNEKLNNFLELIPENKFIIGYTGTLGMANAMEFLMEASEKLNNNDKIHFVIVGSGYLRNKFIEQTKNSTNITFIDKIPKKNVSEIINLFDVCYVGRYDSKLYDFGVSYNKYFDYMLAKKPILESSNHINSPAEVSGCALIVKPENSDAIVEGILKLKDLPKNELDAMGEKGYVYVKKYHNFEYLSNQYLKLF
jgi:hypothetical protein